MKGVAMKILSRLRRENVFFLLDIVLISGIVFLIFSQPRSLQDYEQRCRETPDPKEKEKIALEAVEFLVRQDVPDSIVNQVAQEVTKESLSLPADTLLFPEIPAAMNDSLAGLYEARLAGNLPKLYWMRRAKPESVRSENFTAAGKIAAQLDEWANYAYWMPLMDFLEKADAERWRRWRAAAVAAKLSRDANYASQFEHSKHLAIYGLQYLGNIPDHRLYLDLSFRLQGGIAEGNALFDLGFTLGAWIIRESRIAGYYLRTVSVEYNIGNQLVVIGRSEEALERFKTVLRLAQRWRHIRQMDWYKNHCPERIAAAAYQMNDYSLMLYYLNLFDKQSTSTREKVLFHIRQAQAARYRGNFEEAEKELREAVTFGEGNKKSGVEPDHMNVFHAYLNLGALFLEYNMPEKSLSYYDTARVYGESITGFLNAERLSYYWLFSAQAFVQKKDMTSAQMALDHAKQLVNSVDSPFLRVKHLFAVATLYENMEQFIEASKILTAVRQICNNHGFILQEINAILRLASLSLKNRKDLIYTEYSAQKLEEVIARVQTSGNKWQLINALAIIVDADIKAGFYTEAKKYANLLLKETEALSRLYDEEQRLIFFQHSTYESVKVPIRLDIRLGQADSAFVKLDYAKSRALRQRRTNLNVSKSEQRKLLYADITDIQKRLQPDEAIIDYMVTEDTLYAFAITRFKLQLFSHAVAKRELQVEVDKYLNHLTSDESGKDEYNEQNLMQEFLETVKLSHNLYNKLLGEMVGFLEKSRRLYIIPDEFLHALPFNTLVVREGLEPDFLISSKAIMYLPYASIVTDRIESANGFFHSRIWTSIDPAMYGALQVRDHMMASLDGKVMVKTHWESKKELKMSMNNGYDTYFFYAHAKANWDDPLQSYIQFPLNHPTQRGELSYTDVDSTDWQKAALVILAGCETTGSRIYSGAGLSGLQRSFLTGGARQVLATLWKVDAAQMASQMSDFLDAWNRHGDAMSSLQIMQRVSIAAFKKDAYLKYPHPRFWGAYNLSGTLSPSSSAYESADRSLVN